MPTTITINGNSYSLCAMPATPGPASAEIGMSDAVAVVTSPFTRQEQTQQWSGGDFWDATVTLPPMTNAKAAAWRAFLADLRGRLNVLQLFDPSAWATLDHPVGAPVVNSSVDSYNLPMTTTLITRGWTVNAPRLLLPGQQFQIGYRLHMVIDAPVASDSGGNATFSIWPSIRETPADGTAINLAKPQGLFRLASNRRAIQWSPQRLTTLSFKCVEAK
jgi:hypothetical protein